MIYRFTCDIEPPMTDAGAERLAETCRDASTWSRGGTSFVGFDRESDSLEQAIATAIRDVRSAGFRVSTVRIESADVPAAVG